MCHNTANHNTGTGFESLFALDSTYYNNTANFNGYSGFSINGAGLSINCNVTGNYANHNTKYGMTLQGNNIIIQNNTMNNNGEVAIYIFSPSMDYITITNNTMHGNLECISDEIVGVGNLIESNDCQNRPREGGIPSFSGLFAALAIGLLGVILHIIKLRAKKLEIS